MTDYQDYLAWCRDNNRRPNDQAFGEWFWKDSPDIVDPYQLKAKQRIAKLENKRLSKGGSL